MNGIEFPVDGPMIEGTWQNMKTGDHFEVRDSFIQDGMLIIQAKDGRMFDYNTIQNYVKVDKPIPMEKPKNISPKSKKQLPSELLNEIEPAVDESSVLPEDLELINGQQTNSLLNTTISKNEYVVPPVQVAQAIEVEDEDTRLIKRALDRAKKDPELDVKVKWNKYPDKQMDMLIDVLGVDIDKIVDYYIDKIDLTTIREAVKVEIANIIHSKLGNDECEVAIPEKEQKKTTKKKEAK